MQLTDLDLEILNTLGPIKVKGDIDAPNAQTIDLPQLKESGSIHAYDAKTVNLPQLKESGSINADNAQEINLPQLIKSGNIYADNAETIIIQEHLIGNLVDVPINCVIKQPTPKSDTPTKETIVDSYLYKLMKKFLLSS